MEKSFLASHPAELLDHIVSYVDRPRDLLSLSLASKLFYKIVVPNHIQYRYIACDIARTSLWKLLIERPLLASRIIDLHLFSESRFPNSKLKILPTASQNPSEIEYASALRAGNSDDDPSGTAFGNECVNLVAQAVRYMPNLTRFIWSYGDPRISQTPHALFSALKEACPNLAKLYICGGAGFDLEDASNPLWQISRLSEFKFCLCCPHLQPQHPLHFKYPQPMMRMLLTSHCYTLRILDLSFYGSIVSIADIFKRGYWRNLGRLTARGHIRIYDDNVTDERNPVADFLEKHPRLVRLELDGIDFKSRHLNIKEGSLPYLRHLVLDLDPNSITLPVNIISHLRALGSVDLGDKATLDLLKRMHALRLIRVKTNRLHLATREIIPVLQRIEWLVFMPMLCETGTQANRTYISHCIELFACLPQLIFIEGIISLLSPSSLGSWFMPIIERLGSRSKIRYITVTFNEPRRYSNITVDRDEIGNYTGWHTMDMGSFLGSTV